jgi:hypothetical protein
MSCFILTLQLGEQGCLEKLVLEFYTGASYPSAHCQVPHGESPSHGKS